MLAGFVERFNGEINVKVNYPLKLVFIYMQHNIRILDMTDPHHLGAIQALGRCTTTSISA